MNRNEAFHLQQHSGEPLDDQTTPQDGDPERHPEDADEGQVDEALEETFPASDPISP